MFFEYAMVILSLSICKNLLGYESSMIYVAVNALRREQRERGRGGRGKKRSL